jgi:membrane protein implicated in regulation of membrane protease activity
MDAWVWWTIAACLLAAGEIATTSFFLAPFAAGAALAAVADAAGANGVVAALIFLASSVVLLTFVRPIARRHLKMPPHMRTGTAALVGRNAMVLERIANAEGVGCAKIGGEIWTARAFDDDRVIEPGEPVQVIEIRGATALVD